MTPAPTLVPAAAGGTVRLLSLNIQFGLHSSRYLHYVTHAWRHVVPTRGVRRILDRIATLASGYDLVALQEADAGSLRTSQLNQVAHLAERGGFPHWHAAVTRNLRPFAQHCLGCLSRWPLEDVRYHALPGWLPGRGALEVTIRPAKCEPLRLIIAHLALGRRARTGQLAFLAQLIGGRTDTVVIGDLNCGARELSGHGAVRDAGLRGVHDAHTFPSWRPSRALDHILVTPAVDVMSARVLEERLSDHLPIVTEIRLRLEGAPRLATAAGRALTAAG